MKTIAIEIESLPEDTCISSSSHQLSKGDVLMHLTQECDSYIDFAVNGQNVLNGYDGSFTYPTYAFLKSMNSGLASVLSKGIASIPIFLQQFSFTTESPQHRLDVRVNPTDRAFAFVSFTWCSTIRLPSGLPLVCDSPVRIDDFKSELSRSTLLFEHAASALLSTFEESRESVVDQLFGGFSNL